MRRFLLGGTVGLAALVCTVPTAAAPPLSPDDAARLRTVIRPGETEDPFATIPWESDLWDARTRAAAAGKPLLLWEMDGHPLGCG